MLTDRLGCLQKSQSILISGERGVNSIYSKYDIIIACTSVFAVISISKVMPDQERTEIRKQGCMTVTLNHSCVASDCCECSYVLSYLCLYCLECLVYIGCY